MAEGGAPFCSPPDQLRPDLHIHFVIGIVDQHMRNLHLGDGFSVQVGILRPQSHGGVGLQSANPASTPQIDPGYLSHPADLHTLKRGARITEVMLKSNHLAPWLGARLYPHDGSDQALETAIRPHADTIYHPVAPAGWAPTAWPRPHSTCVRIGWRICGVLVRRRYRDCLAATPMHQPS